MKLQIHYHHLLMGILSLIFLSACTTSPPTSDVHTDKLAVTELLSEAVYTITIFNECEALGGDAELDALSIRQNWLEKNWQLIDAADRYYTEQEQASSTLYRGELLSLNAIYLVSLAQQRALNELNLKQRSKENRQIFCQRRLQKLAKDELKLTQKVTLSTQAFEVKSQPTESAASTTVVRKVPTLAGGYSFKHTQGRSAYQAVNLLKAECPSVNTLVVHNEWPLEAYASYCDNKPLAFLVCEWGKCQRHANQ